MEYRVCNEYVAFSKLFWPFVKALIRILDISKANMFSFKSGLTDFVKKINCVKFR